MSAAPAPSPAPAPAASAPPVPAPGKKRLIIILAIALAVALAGGGATFFVIKKRAAAAAEEARDDGPAGGSDGGDANAHRLPPTYVALDPFVVNLADKDSERYLQVGLTLEVDDPKFAAEMKLYMPAIRDTILMILSHKSAAFLLDRAGKEALAAEIVRESVRPMGIEVEPDAASDAAPAASDAAAAPCKPPAPVRRQSVHNPVRRVRFASFIVQ